MRRSSGAHWLPSISACYSGPHSLQARAAKNVAKRRFAGKSKVVGIGVTRTKGGHAVRIPFKEPPTDPL